MNTHHDPEQDLQQLLESDGGEIGSIYRRLSQPEPPPELDRAVMANAARAIRAERVPPARRWLLGFGSVAGIVLAAGLAWQVGKQVDSNETQSAPDRSHRSVISVEPISDSSREVQKPVSADAAMVEIEASAVPAPPAKQAPAAIVRKKVMSPPPAAKASPPPPLVPRVLQTIEPAVVEPEAARATAPAHEAQAFSQAHDSESSSRHSASADDSREQAAGNAAAMSTSKSTVEQSRAPSPSSSVTLRRNMHLAPQDWLAEIVRLKNANRRQEAIENLRLFRRVHPDWQLSDELQRLAE